MVKIKSMIRKSVNCLVTLSLMFFVFLFVYACSSDADYSAKIEDIDRNLLIKSVAESDVFLDFILEHKLVMEQFMVYTRRLSDTELSEFKYIVNDDEYIQKIVEVTNLSSLLQSLEIKKNCLLADAGYGKLNQEERKILFMNYFEKPMYTAVKTRGEILNLKCYEQYTAECNRAERQCSIAVLACACVGSCACVLAAYLKLNDDLANAKRDFENCQNGK